MKNSLQILMMISSVALVMSGCGVTKGGKSGKKQASSGNAGERPSVTSYGDDCNSGGIATSSVGQTGIIKFELAGIAPEKYSVGYIGNVPNVRVTMSEVSMSSAQEQSYQFEVIFRDMGKCAEQNRRDCQLNGGAAQSKGNFDIVKSVNFLFINSTAQSYANTSNLGRGQDGITSDLINGEGLIGGLAKFAGGSGGGGLGAMTSMIGPIAGMMGGGGGIMGQLGGAAGALGQGGGMMGGMGDIVNSGQGARAQGFYGGVNPGGCQGTPGQSSSGGAELPSGLQQQQQQGVGDGQQQTQQPGATNTSGGF